MCGLNRNHLRRGWKGMCMYIVESEEQCMRVHEILQNSTSCKIFVGHDE